MEFGEILNVILNTGTSVAVIGYFMYRDFKFMKTLEDTLTTLRDSVDLIKNYFIDKKED